MKCDICGAEVSDWDVVSVNIGVKHKHFCISCYKKAQKDVAYFQIDQRDKFVKKENNKK